MTTSTLERRDAVTTPDAEPRERAPWTCENCQAATSALRKRCADCGTSRY